MGIKNSNDDWIALSDLICSDDQPCVCNSLASTWQRDSGRITEKANLPITAFKYGDLTDENANANFKIGPLTCQGNKNPFIVEDEIKKMIVKVDENSGKIDETTRKVDQNSGKIIEVNTNKNNIASLKSTIEDKWAKDKDSKVIFMAYRTSRVYKNTKITFNHVVPNIGSDMNGSSGTFTARIPGNYFLTFSAQTQNGNDERKPDMCVRVKKNSNMSTFLIYDGNDSTDENNLSYSWMFRLQVGDTIHLETCSNTILYGDGTEWITFTGHLLLADD